MSVKVTMHDLIVDGNTVGVVKEHTAPTFHHFSATVIIDRKYKWAVNPVDQSLFFVKREDAETEAVATFHRMTA